MTIANPNQPLIPGLPSADEMLRSMERERRINQEIAEFERKYLSPAFAAKAMGMKSTQLRSLIEQKRLPEGVVTVSLSLRRTGIDILFVEKVAALSESERSALPWWPKTKDEIKQLRATRDELHASVEERQTRLDRKKELIRIAFGISVANLTMQSICATFTWEPLNIGLAPNYHVVMQYWQDLTALGVNFDSINEVRMLGPSEFRMCAAHHRYPVTQYKSLCDILRDQLVMNVFDKPLESFPLLSFAKRLVSLHQAIHSEIALNMIEQLLANQLAQLRNQPLESEAYLTLAEMVADTKETILSKKRVIEELIMYTVLTSPEDTLIENESLDLPLSALIHAELRLTYPLASEVLWGLNSDEIDTESIKGTRNATPNLR